MLQIVIDVPGTIERLAKFIRPDNVDINRLIIPGCVICIVVGRKNCLGGLSRLSPAFSTKLIHANPVRHSKGEKGKSRRKSRAFEWIDITTASAIHIICRP